MRRVVRLHVGESAAMSLKDLAKDLAQAIECSVEAWVDVQLHDPATGRYRVVLEGRLPVVEMVDSGEAGIPMRV